MDSEEHESGHVRHIVVKDGKYTILWGLDVPDDESEQYSMSPVVAANCLLNQLFQRRANTTSETPRADFEWWTGGAMQKFSNRPLKAVAAEARTNVSHQLKDETPLQFVYDFCSVDADFESLEFVLDAGRRPLEDLDAASFKQKYSLPRKLSLSCSEARRRVLSDWWSAVYD